MDKFVVHFLANYFCSRWGYYFIELVYQQIVIAPLLHSKCSVSFPRMPVLYSTGIVPVCINYRIRGFFCARKNLCRTCHYEVKCRKALWLQACEALWSNCERTQSKELRFFLCKKYELLLRSVCSSNVRLLSSGWNMMTGRLVHELLLN